jgi:hypothetical protein
VLGHVLKVDARHVRPEIVRRRESMERGEPQVVPASALDPRKFPAAKGIPFLSPLDMWAITADEYAESAWTVTVYPTDAVEIAHTRGKVDRPTSEEPGGRPVT